MRAQGRQCHQEWADYLRELRPVLCKAPPLNSCSRPSMSQWVRRLYVSSVFYVKRIHQMRQCVTPEAAVVGEQTMKDCLRPLRYSLSNLRILVPQDWLLIFVKRDAQKGADFADQMKKICPSIGIQIRDPTIITLNDDRTETYIKVPYSIFSILSVLSLPVSVCLCLSASMHLCAIFPVSSVILHLL